MTEAIHTRLRLDLAYHGAGFSGWATQPGLRTVQGDLERALATVTHSDPQRVRLTVAGRTDAGVHARGQVAHIDLTESQYARWLGKASADNTPAARQRALTKRLNGVLTGVTAGREDVVVWCVRPVTSDFDARFSAVWRRYEYRITDGVCDPLEHHRTAVVRKPIHFEALQQASAQLVGLRDFSTFCKAREGATAIRHLTDFSWTQNDAGVYLARIQADAFCHSMVRSLVGAVVAVATGRITASRLNELTAAKQRSSEFTVMPAHGLSLEEIGYPDETDYAARAAQTRARRSDDDIAPATIPN